MRGIILAGGAGSRLDPITRVASKQLQPVYDKPMIYYPLGTLMEAGIKEILVITTPEDSGRFKSLLGDGRQWGIELEYEIQPRPGGIAQALTIGETFIGNQAVALILGDNIFHGQMELDRLVAEFDGGGLIFGYPVSDPKRYGVIEVGEGGVPISIEEKPSNPRSRLATPGLYFYGPDVVEVAKNLTPSARGELEITDVNRFYLNAGRLRVITLGRGIAWLDSGTHDSLLEAANFVATIERRQGLKLACLEELAYLRGYLTQNDLARTIEAMPASSYRDYLVNVLRVDQSAKSPGP